jgi:hypothetical protein
MKKTTLVDLKVDEWKHETDKAWLFVIEGADVWIPKSIGEFDPEDDEGVVTVPEWWAIEEELI